MCGFVVQVIEDDGYKPFYNKLLNDILEYYSDRQITEKDFDYMHGLSGTLSAICRIECMYRENADILPIYVFSSYRRAILIVVKISAGRNMVGRMGFWEYAKPWLIFMHIRRKQNTWNNQILFLTHVKKRLVKKTFLGARGRLDCYPFLLIC